MCTLLAWILMIRHEIGWNKDPNAYHMQMSFSPSVSIDFGVYLYEDGEQQHM